MAVTITERPETLLVAFRRPDPAGPVVVAAHLTKMVEHFDGATGRHEAQREVPAAAISLPEVEAIIGSALALALAERDAARADTAAQADAHAAAVAALNATHAQTLLAKDAEHTAALEDRDADLAADKRAAVDAAAEASSQALSSLAAEKDAVIAGLQDRIAELTAPPAVRKVWNYRFKLALNSLGVLDAANHLVAVSPADVGLYWGGGSYGAGAPEFFINDPLLVQMAAALIQQLGLQVTLHQVFDLADTFR